MPSIHDNRRLYTSCIRAMHTCIDSCINRFYEAMRALDGEKGAKDMRTAHIRAYFTLTARKPHVSTSAFMLGACAYYYRAMDYFFAPRCARARGYGVRARVTERIEAVLMCVMHPLCAWRINAIRACVAPHIAHSCSFASIRGSSPISIPGKVSIVLE